MLERCFKNPLTLHRLHSGPAGPFLDGFAESMGADGYSSEMIGSYCTPPTTWASGPRRAAWPSQISMSICSRVLCVTCPGAGAAASAGGTGGCRSESTRSCGTCATRAS